jgi:phage terminase small subunit
MAGLTNKQRVFVEEYLRTWNATQSALAAGYSARTARFIGAENLTKPIIAEAIQARLSELKLSADEVLVRLGRYARGSLRPFLQPSGEIDLSTEEAQEHLDLLKRVKVKKRSGGSGDNAWTESEVDIEIVDPLTADVHIGRHHKLFTDKAELNDGQPLVVKVLRGVSMDDL